MQHILSIIWDYVTTHHNALFALVGGAGGLSIAVQWFLHKFKIDGAKLAFTLSHIFAFATAVSAYYLDNAHPNAGVTYGWIWVLSQFWHRFAVNPAYNKYVLPFLDWLTKQRTTKVVLPA